MSRLLCTVAACLAAGTLPAQADVSCSGNPGLDCNIGQGAVAAPATYSGNPITVTNAGSFSATASSTVRFTLSVQSPATGTGQAGGNVTYIGQAPSATTLSLGLGTASNLAAALRLDSTGSAGSDGSTGQAGGAAGSVSATLTSSTVRVDLNGASSAIASSLYGLRLVATGGAGGSATSDKQNGGAGGAGGAVTATLTQSSVTVSAPLGLPGAAVLAESRGGAGGTARQESVAGTGGAGLPVSLTMVGGGVGANGAKIDGVAVQSTGGAGGFGYFINGSTNKSDAAAGGIASGSQLTLQGTSSTATISTNGDNAVGAAVRVTGGTGGNSSDTGTNFNTGQSAGAGGKGGDVSNASVLTTSGPVSVATNGTSSPGVLVAVSGGAGGATGQTASVNGDQGRAPGTGGAAADSRVNLGTGTTVNTGGNTSSAVVAQSQGGRGGSSGETYAPLDAAEVRGVDGARGGDSGVATVATASGVTLKTTGDQSHGILAQSLSGSGGYGGQAQGPKAVAGKGGAGGTAAGVTVTNAATITTSGAGSNGILAQTLSAAGGGGGSASSAFDANGGTGGASGAVGTTTVTNAGRIATSGIGAGGILAQSIAGGGGAGGTASGAAYTIGGKGSTDAAASNGGGVTLTSTGSVTTTGDNAAGIVGQSIGGGGGTGGSASGVVYTVGGTGTGGGAGGTVAAGGSGSVTTSGSQSAGLLVQSVGGGGGTGGNATSNGAVVSMSVGGKAGTGGDGGQATAGLGAVAITTTGTGASGVLVQSVGGGGGTGGAAYAVSASPTASFASAVGGTGGAGGNGGIADAVISGSATAGSSPGGSITTGRAPAPTATPPVDSIGLLVQSIGGGGGVGGGASAKAVAITIPTGDPKTNVAISAAYSAGGSGAMGGNGGLVQASIDSASRVTTAGAGSIAVLAQSIGGGGGQGGDSSAMAATIGYIPKIVPADSFSSENTSVSIAVGGKGAGGGAGGPVSVNLGTANPTEFRSGVFSTITTTGDGASGLVGQSVGGGGGNAGVGSARLGSVGKNSTLDVSVALGATAGAGGAGGRADGFVDRDSVVVTAGSGASGVIVQSVGGGGGISSGGAIDVSGIHEIQVGGSLKVNPSVSVSLGASGKAGGNGGAVAFTHQGSITTTGNDAPGAIVQSIGGGGGIGGAAGTDVAATGDATEPAAASAKTAEAASSKPSVTLELKANVSLGGSGGSAGNGGAVTISMSNPPNGGMAGITTSGDFSPGLVAQSIGGGGGRGGSAIAGGEDTTLLSQILGFRVNTATSLGASGGGGTGGDGGPVTATLTGTITTGQRGTGSAGTGAQSFGVLLQSVGGGGGIGSDGTPDPSGQLLLGAGLGGTGGAAGNGGTVTAQEGSAQLHAYTSGNAAHGVVLQSIGGGGGVGGAGGTITNTALYSGTLSTSLGSSGASGNGGNVNLDFITINPETTGNGAFGILAQSVGGGGGLATVGNSSSIITTLARLGGGSGNGGNVTVTLGSNSRIVTSGIGSHGVVAQSVGGGGGIYQLVPAAGSTPAVSLDSRLVPLTFASGNGGAVTVNSAAAITATGAGSIGILAQSVGAGGGIATIGNQTYIGGTGTLSSGDGVGGPVSVTSAGTVIASGMNGIGIFAESADAPGLGPASNVNVAVTGGSVQGGSGQGAGIYISNAVVPGQVLSRVSVAAGASVSALSGLAITVGTSSAPIAVTNNGTITGSMSLGSGGSVSGSGTLVPVGASVITGNVTLSPGAAIAPAADFAAGTAGSYRILGNAVFAGGTIRPTLASVVANVRLPVLTVTGTTTGTLAVTPSALFDFAVQPTATASGSRFDLVATGGHFSDSRYGLTPGRAAVATGLERLFAAGAPAYGTFFADLDAVASARPDEYGRRLAQLAPRAALSVGARRAAEAAGIANAAMSCPVFSGATSFLVEGACVYAKAGGRTTHDFGGADQSGLRIDSATFQIGGQAEIAPGLFLGGAAAYERSWLSGRGDGVSGTGNVGQGAVTLKWQTGPWLLTGAVFGGAGGFDVARLVNIPGIGGIAKGSPTLQSVGARVRAAYTIGADPLYLRPYLNVDGIWARTGAYREYGVGAFGLAYDSASQTTAVVTPAVELGGRFSVGGLVARAFVSAGASVRTDDSWRVTARLVGAPPGSGSFTTTVGQGRVSARVGTGAQLFVGQRLDLRLQYDGEFSRRATSHGGALTLAYRL